MKTLHAELSDAFDSAMSRGISIIHEVKASNPSMRWYPYQSQDKIALMKMVKGYLERSEVRCLSDRPSLLDVGAADGDLSFLFKMSHWDVTMIDNAPSNYNDCDAINFLNREMNMNIKFHDIDIDWGFPDLGGKTYDIAFFLDILYHLRNPMRVLIDLLHASRFCFISTRICEKIGRLDVSKFPVSYLLAPMEAAPDDPTNYWIPTEVGFFRMLERCGWQVRKLDYFGYSGKGADPADPRKDKRIICLCERMENFEVIKTMHHIPDRNKTE